MFGLSLEHILIAGLVLMFFGPRHLPNAGAALGKAVRNFREHFNGPNAKNATLEAEFQKLDPNPNKEKHDASRA